MTAVSKLSATLILSLLIISCEDSADKSIKGRVGVSDFQSSIELVKEGQLIIEIDSVTPPRITSYFYVQEENALVFMNVFTNSLYKYSLDNSELISIEYFPKEGPKGLGQFANTSEFVFEGDSMVFYDYSIKNLVFLNEEREILQKTNFAENPAMNPYGMWSNWINPYKTGYSLTSSVIRQSLQEVSGDVDSLELFFNPETEELSRLYLPIPDVYVGKWWLPEYMRYYRAYNSERDEYVYSWPISDSIFIKDSSGKLRARYMGTDNYRTNVPLPENVSPDFIRDFQRKLTYYYEQGEYSYLYYDSFRDLFFRSSFSGIKEGRVDVNNTFDNKDLFDRTLIISNGDYEKIGEFNADVYVPNVAVFTKEIMLLLREVDNEDLLVFDKFKIVHKE